MKKIKLTRGKYAMVDDEDFEWLNEWKWCLSSNGYATRTQRIGLRKFNKRRSIRMHRLINNTPIGFETDHINRNKLDNRRINLRSVTRSQNKMNLVKFSNNTSGYLGVFWHKAMRKWCSQIRVEGKTRTVGFFLRLGDAVKARKEAEKIYYTI